ncbi:MAG: Stp1/IreP family PP2C-type Ser/Thr phosphatase [bacterium]
MPSVPTGEVVVHVFGRTDVGRTREHNEDAFVVADLTADNATLQPEVRKHVTGPKGTLFMVADGMGGAAAGEIASAMAVEVVLSQLRGGWLTDSTTTDVQAFVRALKVSAKAANEQIHSYATAHPEYRGMGTTATIAGLLGDTLYLAQVGDSRAYIVRDGVARQITKDQSLMQKLIEAGELTEEEAEHSERRNIILQALGPEPSIKVDLTHQIVRRGDALVLCSDGLSGQVSKDDIASVVAGEPDLTNACRELIDRANSNGGPDNITVIIARFDGAGLQGPAVEDHVGHTVFQLPETGQTPAMSLDRVIESDTPTKPVPVLDRARQIRRSDPTAPREAKRATPPASPVAPAEPVVVVSPARRSTGRLIAVVLLTVLVVGAVWLAFNTIRSRGVPPTTTTPGR